MGGPTSSTFLNFLFFQRYALFVIFGTQNYLPKYRSFYIYESFQMTWNTPTSIPDYSSSSGASKEFLVGCGVDCFDCSVYSWSFTRNQAGQTRKDNDQFTTRPGQGPGPGVSKSLSLHSSFRSYVQLQLSMSFQLYQTFSIMDKLGYRSNSILYVCLKLKCVLLILLLMFVCLILKKISRI